MTKIEFGRKSGDKCLKFCGFLLFLRKIIVLFDFDFVFINDKKFCNMILRIAFLLRKIGMAIGLLIITSALPARAQSEFYDEFYEDDSDYQEWLLKFEYSNDLNGYIVSPNKSGVGENQDWDHANVLHVPSIRLLDGKPVVALSGFGSLKWLFDITFPEDCHVKYICDNCH
ncbi:MAG: hypothetical protein ACI4BC_06790, partial [Muribaculaceae bacterium]